MCTRTPLWLRRIIVAAGLTGIGTIALAHRAPPVGAAGGIPAFDHTFTIVMENHN